MSTDSDVEKNARRLQYYNAQRQRYGSSEKIGAMHGARRVLVFCIMTAILPTILIITPLYLRHVVFVDVTYPVAESDVLIIEEGISSVFCSKLSLKMNSSFNAFHLQGTPQLSSKRKHIRLKKSMSLPDDTLEYWGFYLLGGAMVKLKVCSRYEGSRILVVRGDKELKTCGLMEHNMMKYGAKFDIEHSRVKVTYEHPAEEIGVVDHENVKKNEDKAEEDIQGEEVDIFVRKKIGKGKSASRTNVSESLDDAEQNNSTTEQLANKIHNNKHVSNIDNLKNQLYGELQRPKRGISELDAHIKHGGNAINNTEPLDVSISASSFETDLLTCYDGQILLTEGFAPSEHCKDVGFLDRGDHMTTTHEVASDGYYYYIFYSDNDYVKNDIHAVFDIYKPTYRYSSSTSKRECVNATECHFDLGFISDEVVIVEVPTRDGIEHELDDITLLTSTCHPRSSVYMIFPILVLLLILGCAFL